LATTSQEVWEEEVVERADEEEMEKFMNRYWQADEEGTMVLLRGRKGIY
jgi:hypothetical protein